MYTVGFTDSNYKVFNHMNGLKLVTRPGLTINHRLRHCSIQSQLVVKLFDNENCCQ